ncbi:MAG: class I SAM-dependent methyltransferase [Thermomicrobiales bacterium]|nr:class I SAM-dependent methyltransferase [Thermomicrobiales bacterium]MCO5223390.1 class I SAM-dependent methyltransferase [Thermomicrobiales bacterium]
MSDGSDPVSGDVWKDQTLVTTFLTGVRAALPNAADQLDVMLRVLASIGRPIRRVLDLGSGSGVLAGAILDRFPDAEMLLADFSEPMLEVARHRFPSPPHALRIVDFSQEAWVAQVSDHAPFDAVVSGFAIHHQPDVSKRRIYAEIFHLLAPGAPFIHIEHVSSATPWIEHQFNELLVDRMYAYDRDIGGGRTREQVATDYVYRPDKAANILAPLEIQLEWLREIGYRDVDCLFKIYELCLFIGRKPE